MEHPYFKTFYSSPFGGVYVGVGRIWILAIKAPISQQSLFLDCGKKPKSPGRTQLGLEPAFFLSVRQQCLKYWFILMSLASFELNGSRFKRSTFVKYSRVMMIVLQFSPTSTCSDHFPPISQHSSPSSFKSAVALA